MNSPGFFVLGTTHQRAPLAVREKLALDAEASAALQTELATIAGLRVELIGAHLRSKLNSTRTGIWEDEARTTFTEPYR